MIFLFAQTEKTYAISTSSIFRSEHHVDGGPLDFGVAAGSPRRADVARNSDQVAAKDTGGQIYLPFVTGSPSAPSFTIVNPLAGSTVAGTIIFAIRVDRPDTVTSRNFKAGSKDLGAGVATADGFQVYVDARQLPAGPATFTATVSGSTGSAEKSTHVTVQPNPPASTTVKTDGAVVASAIGSVITVPPGGAPPGTQVSVVEKTQQQVTADTGINWDALGVTFLGAQVVTANNAFQKPLGVSSAGFGQRVKPGDAIVNYQILPDSNHDGVGELVAVNTASAAPNQNVVSDPVPGIQLGTASRAGKTGAVAAAGAATTLSGPPGATFEIAAAGLNPASAQGNVAVFHTQGGADATIPAMVRPDKQSPLGQTALVMIPLLPAGPATLTLRNESTGDTSTPISVIIQSLGKPSKPAAQIIDQSLATNEAALNQLSTLLGGQASLYATTITGAINHTKKLRTLFQQISAHPTAQQTQALNDIATMIENSNILLSLSTTAVAGAGIDTTLGLCDNLGQFSLIDASVGALGALVAGIGTSGTALTALGLTVSSGGTVIVIGAAIAAAAIGAGIAAGVACWGDNPPSGCGPASSGSGAGTTGMGSAPPSGGSGCGNTFGGGAGGGSVQTAQVNGAAASQYIVKIFPRVRGSGANPIYRRDRSGRLLLYSHHPGKPAVQSRRNGSPDGRLDHLRWRRP